MVYLDRSTLREDGDTEELEGDRTEGGPYYRTCSPSKSRSVPKFRVEVINNV